MPTTRQRQRDLAIARKHYETEFLFAEEEVDDIVAPQSLKLSEANVKTETTPGSPISVASTLEVLPGELKSIVLPGAWVVVGKGGKPLKDDKMYDEPVLKALPAKKKKKKKKHKATRTAQEEPEPLLVLEEAASSSTSVREFLRSSTQRKKQLARSKDAKYWAGYQHAKQLQRGALDDLVAKLLLADGAEDEAAVLTPSVKPPHKDHKANSSKDKARRRARSAAAAARCSVWLDDEASSMPVSVTSMCHVDKPPSPWVKVQMSGELQLISSKMIPEPKPPGAWTTVGKRGKSMTNFPPLTTSGKAESKRRESPPVEASDSSVPAGKRAKGRPCSVM